MVPESSTSQLKSRLAWERLASDLCRKRQLTKCIEDKTPSHQQLYPQLTISKDLPRGEKPGENNEIIFLVTD